MDVDFSGDFRSQALFGSYTCRIIGARSLAGSEPADGELRCTGANSAVLLTAGGNLIVDRDNSGSGTTILNAPSWHAFTEGFLLRDRTYPLLPVNNALLPGLETQASLDINITDIVYSDVHNRLFIANDTGIAVVVPEEASIERTITVNGTPGAIELNRDQSQLYIGYTDASTVQTVAIDTGALGDAVELGDLNGEPRFASDIEALNSAADLIVVSMTGQGSALVIENGEVLTNEIPRNANSLAETDNGRLYAYNNRTSGSELQELLVDTNGVIVASEFTSGISTFNTNIVAAGNLILGTSGHLVDPLQQLDISRLDPTQVIGTATFDPDSQRVFHLDQSETQLTVYETSNYTPTGQYEVPYGRQDFRLLPGAGNLFFASSTELHVIDLITVEDYVL